MPTLPITVIQYTEPDSGKGPTDKLLEMMNTGVGRVFSAGTRLL